MNDFLQIVGIGACFAAAVAVLFGVAWIVSTVIETRGALTRHIDNYHEVRRSLCEAGWAVERRVEALEGKVNGKA